MHIITLSKSYIKKIKDLKCDIHVFAEVHVLLPLATGEIHNDYSVLARTLVVNKVRIHVTFPFSRSYLERSLVM